MAGRRQPELHHWDEAVAAGDDAGVGVEACRTADGVARDWPVDDNRKRPGSNASSREISPSAIADGAVGTWSAPVRRTIKATRIDGREKAPNGAVSARNASASLTRFTSGGCCQLAIASTNVLTWRYCARAIGTLQRAGDAHFGDAAVAGALQARDAAEATMWLRWTRTNVAGSRRASTAPIDRPQKYSCSPS